VVIAVRERKNVSQWWILLLEGLVGIIIGIITFFWPAITALILLYIVAIWAIITGLFEIGAAFARPGPTASREWTLAAAGIISVLFGMLLIAQPSVGLLTLVWLVAIYALVFGILLIIRAFQFKSSSNIPLNREEKAPMQGTL
jgi:uncharacterized membrane protein HdeD (DUF308 family)